MTRLYIIRHAEAEGNIMRIFQGRLDADISENGARQLEELRERFKTVKFDAVYSSPLIRAYKTAQAADFYRGLPIKKLDGLAEIDGGRWEGEKWDEIPELFPDENDAWVNEPWNFAPQGGETMRNVYDRVWKAVLGIVKENPGRTVVVTSHGCAIRNFICRAKGLPLERLREIEWFENTAVSTVEFDDDFTPRVVSLNDSAHLGDELGTLSKQDWWQDSATSGVARV